MKTMSVFTAAFIHRLQVDKLFQSSHSVFNIIDFILFFKVQATFIEYYN